MKKIGSDLGHSQKTSSKQVTETGILHAKKQVNDNDTLREVPHPSNEGLALQARVSGPWPHKKESVLLVELAHWQGVQVQTVRRQIVMQRYLK